ncbi:MAG: hypothetical protein QM790_09035 [Nibricoccus sp.]
MIIPLIRLTVGGLLLFLLAGCTLVAPKYVSAPANINQLRDAAATGAKVGEFTADARVEDGATSISLRGNSMVSPYDNSYVEYLKAALRQDLEDARLLDPNSSIEISGMLIHNDINIAGFSKGHASVEARFIIKRGGQVSFDKVKTVNEEWDSSFVGAVAIPKAQQNYPLVVQKLLTSLYNDPDFVAALKKE